MMPYTDDEMDWIIQPKVSGGTEPIVEKDSGLSNEDKARKLAEWQARVWTTPEAWGTPDAKE